MRASKFPSFLKAVEKVEDLNTRFEILDAYRETLAKSEFLKVKADLLSAWRQTKTE